MVGYMDRTQADVLMQDLSKKLYDVTVTIKNTPDYQNLLMRFLRTPLPGENELYSTFEKTPTGFHLYVKDQILDDRGDETGRMIEFSMRLEAIIRNENAGKGTLKGLKGMWENVQSGFARYDSAQNEYLRKLRRSPIVLGALKLAAEEFPYSVIASFDHSGKLVGPIVIAPGLSDEKYRSWIEPWVKEQTKRNTY